MVTEINTEELKEDLIALYEQYIKHGNTTFVRRKADQIYTDCKYTIDILEQKISDAVGPLDAIAWPEMIAKTQRPGMTRERAEKILKELKT